MISLHMNFIRVLYSVYSESDTEELGSVTRRKPLFTQLNETGYYARPSSAHCRSSDRELSFFLKNTSCIAEHLILIVCLSEYLWPGLVFIARGALVLVHVLFPSFMTLDFCQVLLTSSQFLDHIFWMVVWIWFFLINSAESQVYGSLEWSNKTFELILELRCHGHTIKLSDICILLGRQFR